jgi:uncharacterized protein (TIGR02118 family)
MHRLIALYNTPKDPKHFRSHLVETHLPIVAKFPGLMRYEYGFDVAEGEKPSAYYAIVSVDFESAAAMATAISSEAGQAAVADIPNYATAGVTLLSYEIAGSKVPALTK